MGVDDHRIRSAERLAAIQAARQGLLFNSDGKRLHMTVCDYAQAMALGTSKYAFATWEEARDMLNEHWGKGRWSSCPTCLRDPAGEDLDHRRTSTASAKAAPPSQPSDRGVHSIGMPIKHRFTDELDRRPGVYLWCSEYIRYPPRAAALDDVAAELRSRLRKHAPQVQGVLHAIYAGPKGLKTDVENNLFSNVHTGCGALGGASNGVRFEWSRHPTPDTLQGFGCHYAYVNADPDASFRHWSSSRSLARWNAVPLGTLRGDKRLEPVWLANASFRQRRDQSSGASSPAMVRLGAVPRCAARARGSQRRVPEGPHRRRDQRLSP